MTHRPTEHEYALTRRREFDDVYVAEEVEVYRPDVSPRAAPKAHARQWFASALIMVLMAASTGITYGHLPGTGAFFKDGEESTFNMLTANLLDFLAGPPPEEQKVTPAGAAIDVSISITPEDGSVPMHYRVTAVQTGGNDELCQSLQVSTVSPFAFGTAPLLSLNGLAFVPPSMTLSISLLAPVADPATPCNFDIVVTSWDARVAENTGYQDVERIAVTIFDPPAPSSETSGGESLVVVVTPEDDPGSISDIEPVAEVADAEEVVEEVVVEEEPVEEAPAEASAE